jgi:hypothetical protein
MGNIDLFLKAKISKITELNWRCAAQDPQYREIAETFNVFIVQCNMETP